MKLYYSPGACSQSPHIVLREAGIAFEMEKVDLDSKMTETNVDFRTINPNGYVPALVLDDGQILTEGPAIIQYLADQAPQSKLAPSPGTFERVRLQEWLNFVSTEMHKGMGGLFNKKMPAEWRSVVMDTLAVRLDYLSRHLEDHPFLMGGGFTVVDAYLFVVLGWGKWVEVDIGHWPVLVSYCDRIAARPAVQTALAAEG